MSPRPLILLSLIVLITVVVLALVPWTMLASLIIGWLTFVSRVVPQVQWRPGGIGIFFLSFVVGVLCTHHLAGWLAREINAKRSTDNEIRWSLRSSLALNLLVIMLFVVGIGMTGITHQVGWLATSPEPMFVAKTQTQSDSERSTYRPGSISDRQSQSWLFQILLYMNYEMPSIDQTKPWNSVENAKAFRTVVYDAICPSQGNPIWSPDGFGLSHKSGNPNVFQSDTTLRFSDFDQLGETILVGEVNAAFVPWGEPHSDRLLNLGIRRDWSDAKRGEVGYGSVHSSGAIMLMGDGSTRFVADSIDPIVFAELGQIKK